MYGSVFATSFRGLTASIGIFKMIDVAELKVSAICVYKKICTEQRKASKYMLRLGTVLKKAMASMILTAGAAKVKEILEWKSSNLFDCRLADICFEVRRNSPVKYAKDYKDIVLFDHGLRYLGVV